MANEERKGDTYSRREFFRRFIPQGSSLRSGHHPDSKLLNGVDNVVERGAEGFAILAALYIAIKSGQNKLFTYEVEGVSPLSQNPELLISWINAVSQTDSGKAQLESGIVALVNQYSAEYRKSRVVADVYTYLTCSGSGSKRTCTSHTGIRPRTEYYWDEPEEITKNGVNHEVLDSWQDTISMLNSKVNYLRGVVMTPQISEVKSTNDSYKVVVNSVDQSGYNIPRGLAYGAVAGAFCLYEEMIANASKSMEIDSFQNIDKIRIKRRSFLKAAIFVVAGELLGEYQSNFALVNSAEGDRLAMDIEQIISSIKDTSNEQLIAEYLGASIPNIMSFVESIKTTSSNVLEMGNSSNIPGWSEVKPLLKEIIKLSKVAENAMSDTFSYKMTDAGVSYEIPNNLTEAIRAVKVYDMIKQRSAGLIDTPPVLGEALGFFGILAMSALGIEAVSKLSDLPIDALK